jgi:ABC-type lipoprotein export system ATPase subunit
MEIQLKGLVPVPLKDKFNSRTSGIWNTAVTFSQKEWIKIVAPSGTGKTTLMHIIYKLRHDYEGIAQLNNKSLKEINGDELAGLRQNNISVIFQDLRLFENLTARENIELNRVLQKPYYEEKVIDEMSAALGITHILNQKAGVCSYGEQQRVAIIRALVQPFDWLIMDEPFSHLDKANTHKAAKLIAEECKKRNAGFVLTDLDEDSLFPYTRSYSL